MTMVTTDEGGGLEAIDYDNADIQKLIADQIAKGASPMEFKLFIEQCRFTGLNPLMGQIHCVPRYDGKLRRDVFKAQTGIDGFRLIAKRSHAYAGQDEPEWCGSDGQWSDVWLDKDHPPVAARVRVYHHDYARPIVGIVMWDEFVPMIKVYGTDNKPKKDEHGNNIMRVTPMWKEKPAHMLAKCAEAQALRKAFPNELSGLYTDDEMARADAEARRAQRRARKTTATAAPIEHEDGTVRSAPVTTEPPTQEEDLADADALAKFRKSLSDLGKVDPPLANRLLEAWRESGVKPHGAISTAKDLIEAKAFVKTWLTTRADVDDDVAEGEEVDQDTGEVVKTQDETTEPVAEKPLTGDQLADKGLDKNIAPKQTAPDEPDVNPISDRQHRKIRAMFSKALIRGDVRGDVHDFSAELVGMHALKSLKEMSSSDANRVIKALEDLEKSFDDREAAKNALTGDED